MNPYWSYLLTAVGVFGLWLAGRKDRRGWMVGVGAQVLWIAYATATQQWGFYISAVAYGWVYIKNARAWKPEKGKYNATAECGWRSEDYGSPVEALTALNEHNKFFKHVNKEHEVAKNKPFVINVSKEDLFTNRPDMISVIREETRQQENQAIYEKEMELSSSILKVNRYNTAPPFQWYGPDPEPERKVGNGNI